MPHTNVSGVFIALFICMKRYAQMHWKGSSVNGCGWVTTGSGALVEVGYTSHTRFDHAMGTNPYELLAAAHGSSFSMTLAAELENVGIAAEEIQTQVDVSLELLDQQWKAEQFHITTRATVKPEDRGLFLLAALKAKENCPVSKLLKIQITLEVTTDSQWEEGNG